MTRLLSADINATLNNDGTISFTHDNCPYYTLYEPNIDNIRPGEAGYIATLYTDADGSDDPVGYVTWDIIDPDCDDESNACNWDNFTIDF